MKRFLAALFVMAALPAAHAQWNIAANGEASPRDGVTAIGEAEMRVVPDLVEIVVGVQTESTSLTSAQEQNGAAVKAVIAEPKRQGVDPAHIKTEFVTIWGGEARAIVESPSDDWWSSYGSWWGWGAPQSQNSVQNAGTPSMSDQSSVAPGQITVRARVTVNFD